jgi:serine/threonine-protein kinase
MGTAHALPLSRLGEYELLRLISTGATSEIYEARRVGPHGFTRRVAVKRVLPQLASDVRFVRMFCDEARVHARLDHPNLVAVVDFGEHAGELYMAMEYVDGTSLREVMGLPNQRTRIPLGPALRIAREVLSGLSHVHAATDTDGTPLGLVHREVAPGNVLLGSSGEVKLTDFGIVRSVTGESRTLPGELRGALGYVSPEQAMGAQVDARSDLFSLGVLLAEMLIGQPLFPGRTELEVLTQLHAGDLRALETHGRDLPREVHGCLRRFLAQRPVERLADAREAVIEVDRLMTALNAFTGRAELVEFLSQQGTIPLVSNTRLKAAAPAHPATSFRAPDSERRVSYRVRHPSNVIVGPLRLARVLEMVATGRAGLDAEVSRNGGPFFAVSALPELAQVATRPAYRFFDPIPLIATERHPIGPGITARQVFVAARQRATGLICVRGENKERRFYFVDGAIVASSSTEPDELFGSVLVQLYGISPERVDLELERGIEAGVPLGPALVEAGVLSEEHLANAAREQCLLRLARAFSLANGELFFVKDARSGETERPVDPIPSKSLLVEAIRAGVTDAQMRAVLVPAAREELVPCSQQRALFDELGLFPEEIELLGRVAELGGIDPVLRELPEELRAGAIRSIFIGLVSGSLRRKRQR